VAVLLFNLKNVPDDEAADVRELLSQHNIVFYETPAGKWGISVGAIWLNDDVQLDDATHLIEKYQRDRSHHARSEYKRLQQEGGVERIMDRLKQSPVLFVLYLVIISLIVYFSVAPFLYLGD